MGADLEDQIREQVLMMLVLMEQQIKVVAVVVHLIRIMPLTEVQVW
jgi:hypothetical protein